MLASATTPLRLPVPFDGTGVLLQPTPSLKGGYETGVFEGELVVAYVTPLSISESESVKSDRSEGL